MGTRSIGFLLILVLVLAIGSMIDLAQAQTGNRGDGHTEHHDMYKDWEQPDVGGSCCNAQSADDPAGDCRPTTAYIGDDGRWHAARRPGSRGFRDKARRVMCGCPRRCKRSLDGAGDDRVRSCVRPRSAALPHATGRYGDTQTRCRSKTRALSSLTLIAFPGLDLSDQFALTVPRPPSSPTHQRKRLPIRSAPALILDILRPC